MSGHGLALAKRICDEHSRARRHQYWCHTIRRGRFTLGKQSREILAFLRKKGRARHKEIGQHLEALGGSGFRHSSAPLEKLLVFGLVENRPEGYQITKAGRDLDLSQKSFEITTVDPLWLEHFMHHHW